MFIKDISAKKRQPPARISKDLHAAIYGKQGGKNKDVIFVDEDGILDA